MRKRAMLPLLALMMVPTLGSAATYWQITATTSPTALKTNLTAARPANFGNYTTPGGASMSLTKVTNTALNTAASTVDFVVAPVPGKAVIVKVDGVQVGTVPGTYSVAKGTLLNHNIIAYYSAAPVSYTITTQIAAGGTITQPSSGVITLTPNAGYVVSGLIIGSTSYALGGSLPPGVSMTGGASGATYTFPASSYTVKGIFTAAPAAKAIISTPNMTVATGATGIVIDGSTSTSNIAGTAYGWSASCGTIVPTAADPKKATYTAPATVGSCTVTLSVNAAGVSPAPTTTVNITTNSPVAVATQICLDCHNGTDGPASQGFENSGHMGKTSCQQCHNPDKQFSHPYAPLTSLTNVCVTCHTGAQAPAGHTAAQNICSQCHSTHSLQFIGTLSDAHVGGTVLVKAQYIAPVTSFNSGGQCADCHAGNNAAILGQFKTSAHGDTTGEAWWHYDWRSASRAACARCHNATAYVAKLGIETNIANIFNNTTDNGKAGEVLSCKACHSDVATGAVRTPGAYTETYSDGSTFAFPNIGASNLCMRCHSGREAGSTVAADTDADGVRGFINSHYLTAGGTVFTTTGYEFGQTYPNYGGHKLAGVANAFETGTSGPCVACHMGLGAANHTWNAVTKDTSGHVTAINSSACAKCHAGDTLVALVEASREAYETKLEELRLALNSKGLYFQARNPYFFVSAAPDAAPFENWAGVYGFANYKHVMGAAFNYNLLRHDPGGYAHNRDYAMKLIADSIDFIADGLLDGKGVGGADVVFTTIGQFSHAPSITGSNDLNVCATCHSADGPAAGSGAAPTMSKAHDLTGQVGVGNVNVTSDGSSVTMTFNVKKDGVNADNFTFNPSGYRFAASAAPTPSPTYPMLNDFTRTTANPTVVSNGNGNYTATWAGSPPAGNATYMASVYNAAAAPRQQASAVGHLNAPARNFASNDGCINCHGNNAFRSGSHHGANPQGVEACVVCHTRATSVSRGAGGDRTTAYVHGIHNSHNMPSGGYDRQFPTKDGVIDFSVTYPSYMLNCSVCHSTPAQLAAVNAAPVSYSLCLSCHDEWSSFDNGNTIWKSPIDGSIDHATFNWNVPCAACHNGTFAKATAADYHNGLLTERNGLIWNGKDVSVTEGAKIDMQFNTITRTANDLAIQWTATQNGSAVDPCNTTAGTNAPTWQSGFSILRAYGQGDDWVNAGIGTAPGQPVATNLALTGGSANTVCASNIATTTIPLTAAEQVVPAGTKMVVALQGKPQVAFTPSGTTIPVRAKTPTKEFVVAASGSFTAPAQVRRDITDTGSCLKCHVGSLYQHGGNRIDNVDMCVMCHNEASSDQNNRVFDGVSASVAYDGKAGQTYGFKSLLHAIHSAAENSAISMIYRINNGNYVWTGHNTTIPNYPTLDVSGQPLKSGAQAYVYGSSAPHGTGPGGTVARAHNLYMPTYPQASNNCAACHKPGTFGFPDPAKAVATTLNVGSVAPTQAAATHANYGNQLDDTLQGPAAAACMSCHQSTDATKKAWLDDHASKGGFTPAVLSNGRTDVLNGTVKESCAGCHK